MKRILISLTSLTILCATTHAQDRPEKRDRPDAQQKGDWDQIKQRIESAVDRGDMTRDQANAKYSEMKRNLENREVDKPEQKRDHDNLPREARLKMLLGRLVESDQISREVAGQIYQLAFEGREQHRENDEIPRHLERMAGELERLIDRARHELAEIEETREHLNGERRERRDQGEQRTHEQEIRQNAGGQRRAAMERNEAIERHQLEMRKMGEMHARELQKKRMVEEQNKHVEARERAEKERPENRENDKQRDKEEQKERR